MEVRESLEILIERCTRPESLYWSFRQLEGADPKIEQDVEVRINLSPSEAASFNGAAGWSVNVVETDGTIWLRRRQQMTDDAVRTLIGDALTVAYNHGGTFWSWIHGEL